MYTRNYTRTTRKYTPPPGYDGNAFPESDTPSVKYHEAEDDLPRRPPVIPQTIEEDVTEDTDLFADPLPTEEPVDLPTEIPVQTQPSPQTPTLLEEGFHSLEHLFRQLRGNFGREELILVLVMLLIASDASIELLFLALLLVIR